jgi:arsenate reductase
MTANFPITVYHNPACGTSRNTLAMIREAGYEPEVIEYLKAGWSKPLLQDLMAKSGLTAPQLMRDRGTPAEELGLLEPGVAEDAILDSMLKHPILVNRPIVVTPKGVKLCRPSEEVYALLEKRPEKFVKEDGEVVKG